MSTHIVNPEFDFSKLSVEDKLALSKRLQEEARREAGREFESTINFLAEKLKKMGRTKTDAVIALVTLMDDGERRECVRKLREGGRPGRPGRPAAPAAKKKDSDYKDWDGESRSIVGKTYRLPDNPEVQFTRRPVGAINKQFLAAVRSGSKWKDMEVK